MNSSDAPSQTEEPKKSGQGTNRRIAKLILAVPVWLLLLLAVFIFGVILQWSLLAVILVGAAPVVDAIIGMLIFLAIGAVFSWLLARFFTSFRIVVFAIISLLSLVLIVGIIQIVASPDNALFLARTIGWGDSDVLDYQKFPERAINNAPPPFNFRQNPAAQLFETIRYTQEGEPKEQPLAEFLESTDTTSFIVIKDDAILYEGYANGYDRESIVTSFSIAKSFTSALVGIAIDEGYIKSVDDPMVDYLPEMKGRGLDDVTIRDLLLMSSGVSFIHQDQKSAIEEAWPFHDEALSYYHPNMRDLALNLEASEEPAGAVFNYNQYHPLLLGMILERTTGLPVSHYLEQKIWKPLGMEFPASWSLDSAKHGFEKMESGINGRAIDFAKFGRLFLNEGDWDGKRIISAEWVKESTAPDPSDDRPFQSDRYWQETGGYYKYMWWGKPRAGGGYIYFAHGHLGQIIAVSPRDKAIVVRFGITDGLDSWDDVCEQVIEKIR
jgi:CubicO group peptidase (beta-lactamase class C family)